MCTQHWHRTCLPIDVQSMPVGGPCMGAMGASSQLELEPNPQHWNMLPYFRTRLSSSTVTEAVAVGSWNCKFGPRIFSISTHAVCPLCVSLVVWCLYVSPLASRSSQSYTDTTQVNRESKSKTTQRTSVLVGIRIWTSMLRLVLGFRIIYHPLAIFPPLSLACSRYTSSLSLPNV